MENIWSTVYITESSGLKIEYSAVENNVMLYLEGSYNPAGLCFRISP